MKFLIFLLSFLSVNAWAASGVVNGGGGRGVFCKQADGRVVGTTLDLYEGEVIWRYHMNALVGNFKQEIHAISAKLGAFMMPEESNADAAGYRGMISIYDRLQDIPRGSHLKDTGDSFEPVIPNDCEVKQVINYYGEEVILVDRELFNLLTPQSQVAMLAHEWVYAWIRSSYEVTGSKSARRTIAKLFSNEKLPAAGYSFDHYTRPYIECHNNEIRGASYSRQFYIYSPTNDIDAPGLVFDFASYKHACGDEFCAELLHSTLFSTTAYASVTDLSLNCLAGSVEKCATTGLRVNIVNPDLDTYLFASREHSNKFAFGDPKGNDLDITCKAHNFIPSNLVR